MTTDWAGPFSLNSVCTEIRSGFWGDNNASPDRPVPVKVIRNGDLSPDGQLKGWADRFFSLTEASRAQVQLGDCLFTGSGDIGKTYRSTRNDLHVSNFVRVLRPSPQLASGFLEHALRLPAVQQIIDRNAGGSTIKNLRKSFFDEPWLRLPDVEEQRRIVAVLEDHLSRLDAADDYLANGMIRLQRALVATVYHHLAQSGASPVPLGDVAHIVSGSTPRKLDDFIAANCRVDRDIPFYKVGELNHGSYGQHAST